MEERSMIDLACLDELRQWCLDVAISFLARFSHLVVEHHVLACRVAERNYILLLQLIVARVLKTNLLAGALAEQESTVLAGRRS